MVNVRGGLLVAALIATLGCAENRCQVDLETFSTTCPQTFDGTSAALPACPEDAFTYTARACGDLLGLAISYLGTNGATCYYDASSHELVGAKAWTDVPTTCGGTVTSYAGRTASSCAAEPLAVKDCSSRP
jgi:hypothetical protein